jgi:hypothetical protein
MTSKAFCWSLIGPAVWIAILLLAASDQANSAIHTLRPAQILLEASVRTPRSGAIVPNSKSSCQKTTYGRY